MALVFSAELIAEKLLAVDSNFLTIVGPIYKRKIEVRNDMMKHVSDQIDKVAIELNWSKDMREIPTFQQMLFHGVQVYFALQNLFLLNLCI